MNKFSLVYSNEVFFRSKYNLSESKINSKINHDCIVVLLTKTLCKYNRLTWYQVGLQCFPNSQISTYTNRREIDNKFEEMKEKVNRLIELPSLFSTVNSQLFLLQWKAGVVNRHIWKWRIMETEMGNKRALPFGRRYFPPQLNCFGISKLLSFFYFSVIRWGTVRKVKEISFSKMSD